jgi:minor extracellular serine protease Vpr
MVVVLSAGNDAGGEFSISTPAFATIESPGDAPSAIAVGATTNSHFMVEGVEVPGAGVPSNLQQIAGALGDGPISIGAVGAPLRNTGPACDTLPAGSLTGAFALIERGGCPFLTKTINAEIAGASGVIFYMDDQSPLSAPAGLFFTHVPSIMISNNDGLALKSFIDANPDHTAFIDPSAIEQSATTFNQLTLFSSLGPSLGDNGLKPDVVAPGGSNVRFANLYMAAQSYDPLGALYSANRYAAASGTSFAAPLVAGAAALVKKAHPRSRSSPR